MIGIDEKVWAQVAHQTAQTEIERFDWLNIDVKITLALRISDRMRNSLTREQFNFKYPGLDLKAANEYLIGLL